FLRQQLQAEIRGPYIVRFFGNQRPFLAEAISRTGKCECHNQSKQRKYSCLDCAQIAALVLRFFHLPPDAKATTNSQQRQHASEEQYSKQKWGDRRFHRMFFFYLLFAPSFFRIPITQPS